MMWVGPSGEQPLLPKDEGIGTMISAFVNGEHGLTRRISEQLMKPIFNAEENSMQTKVRIAKATGHITTWSYSLMMLLMSSR